MIWTKPLTGLWSYLKGQEMRRIFIHIISALLPTKRLRKKVRRKLNVMSFLSIKNKFISFIYLPQKDRKHFKPFLDRSYMRFAFGKQRYSISGNNNRIIVVLDGKEYTLPKSLVINGLDVKIEGNNNAIRIEFPIFDIKNNHFSIVGDNNIISIKKTKYIIHNLTIGSHWGKNRSVLIDEDFSVDRLYLWLEDNDSSVTIGKDCMFSHDLFFRQSDGHCVVDEKGSICNKATKMVIGDHVWIGAWVRLCKNVCIPDGCIVGMGSVVTKKFTEENAVIAGNPAKVVKQNIHWIRENINCYSERIKNA